MTAPVIASTGTYAEHSFAPSVPSGVASGSLVLVLGFCVYTANVTPTTAALTPPTGFTVDSVTSSWSSADGITTAIFLCHKYATGSDTGAYTFTTNAVSGTSPVASGAGAVRVTGGPASGNPWVDTLRSNARTASGTTLAVSTFTPTGDNSTLIAFSTADASGSTTLASGFTSLVADDVNGLVALSYKSQTTAAATGTLTWTVPTTTAGLVVIGTVRAPLAAPSGLTVSNSTKAVGVSFSAVSGADSYVAQWRRTDLSPPSAVTQTSAPTHLDRIDDPVGTDSTYTYTYDGTGVRVYAMTQGIRTTHTEFTGRSVATGHAVDGGTWNSDPADGDATSIASLIIGNKYGSGKGATLVVVSSIDPDETQWAAAVAWVLADYAAHPGPALFTTPQDFIGSGYSTAQAMIQSLLDAGLPVIMAAGNNGVASTDADWFPGDSTATTDKMVVVGWSTAADARASGSNYGPALALYAPSNEATMAGGTSDTATKTGGETSEASAMTAGVAAKILQANPKLSYKRLREVLTSQALNVVTSVPSGPTVQLNSNANTDGWSNTAAATSFTLDGLDPGAYEIRVATVKSGVQSDWSTAVAGTANALATGTITGVGSISAVGALGRAATFTIAGTGAVTASGRLGKTATAIIAGTGTVTPAGLKSTGIGVSVTAAGTVTTSGSVVVSGSAVLAGSGTVSADGTVASAITASIAGTGTIAVSGLLGGDVRGDAGLAAVGAILAAGAVVATAVLVFTPPTQTRTVSIDDSLFGRMTLQVGVSVLRVDGAYVQQVNPDPALVALASEAYLGGHDTPITQDEADSLTAAGYGPYISERVM